MQVRADDRRNDAWRDSGACNPYSGVARTAGVDIPGGFESEDLEEQRIAALFCHQFCPEWVRAACLAYAMDTGDENYVYGGTTETERRHLLERRRKDRQSAESWASGGGHRSDVL